MKRTEISFCFWKTRAVGLQFLQFPFVVEKFLKRGVKYIFPNKHTSCGSSLHLISLVHIWEHNRTLFYLVFWLYSLLIIWLDPDSRSRMLINLTNCVILITHKTHHAYINTFFFTESVLLFLRLRNILRKLCFYKTLKRTNVLSSERKNP